MYGLYLKFVDQVKQEEIKTYNERHRDYLIRAGKIQPPPNVKAVRTANPKPKREQPNRENIQDTLRVAKTQPVATPSSDERPLKGSANYNIPQEDQAYQEKPIRSNKNVQRPAAQNLLPAEKPAARIKVQKSSFQPPIKPNSKIVDEVIISKAMKTESEPLAEFQEVVLLECPEGCGKKFNERALEKHVKLCGKGQVKRKVFHAKVVDDEALELKKEEKADKKPKGIPKWKMESNRFRNALNREKAAQDGTPPPPALPEEDERVECPGCGRKFNAQPAAKHIPNCLKRNKKK